MTDAPAFFRAIEADPDDDTPRLVYADWLDENAASDSDRARAEFIRVQCELAREPGWYQRTELEGRERQLLTAHGAAWGHPWPVKPLDPDYRRGFLDPVTLPGNSFAPHAERLAELMPLFHLRLVRARGVMKAVAACWQLARIRRLTLTGAWLRNADMTAFAVSPHLGNLQHLDLSHNQIGVRGATDLAAAKLPVLHTLNLASNPIRDRGLLALFIADWSKLEHLNVSDCDLTGTGIVGIANSALARRLVSLQLSRNPDVPWTSWHVLAAAPMERLERLDLSTVGVTNEVVEALAANPALKALRTLHLGATAVTERGARAILESPHLRGLTRLRLPAHNLDSSLLNQLQETFGAGFNPGN